MRDSLARYAIFGLLVAALAVPALAAEAPAGPPPWSERGIFVFAPRSLDFKYGLEEWVPRNPTALVNCSTEKYYCAYASVIHLALPRTCSALKVGDSWTAGGITTEVIAEMHNTSADLGIHSYGPKTALLLASPRFPDVVYEYWGEGGIQNIYYVFQADLIAAARAGSLQEFAGQRHGAFRLQTLDPFGPCAPQK